MSDCTHVMLHRHADHIAHCAAVGGWVDERTGERYPMSRDLREAWARDAGVIREHAHAQEVGDE